MKNIIGKLVIIFCSILLLACSHEQNKSDKVILKVNNYELSKDDFQFQLAAEYEYDENFKLTYVTKKEFLNELIMKELLVQEAMRLELDRDKKFIQAIEKYWESALVRNLIDKKYEEFSTKTLVAEEEIDQFIKTNNIHIESEKNAVQRNEILEEIKGQKVRDAVEAWNIDLRKKAAITVDDSLL